MRPCRSPVCWTGVGERSSIGLDLVKDTSEKVDMIAPVSNSSSLENP